jgi:hypothetical protein
MQTDELETDGSRWKQMMLQTDGDRWTEVRSRQEHESQMVTGGTRWLESGGKQQLKQTEATGSARQTRTQISDEMETDGRQIETDEI